MFLHLTCRTNFTSPTKTKMIPMICWQVLSHFSSYSESISVVLFTRAKSSLHFWLSYSIRRWDVSNIRLLALGLDALTTKPMHTKRMPAHLNQASLWKRPNHVQSPSNVQFKSKMERSFFSYLFKKKHWKQSTEN